MLPGSDYITITEGSVISTTQTFSSYSNHSLQFSLTCTLTSQGSGSGQVHLGGAVHVAQPGQDLPEPQVSRVALSPSSLGPFNLIQGPEDLVIDLSTMKNNVFRISLYTTQHHEYAFHTPDCLFLKLVGVTPYEINCQDMQNLTMCTRTEEDKTMFLDLKFLVERSDMGTEDKQSCSLLVENLDFVEQFGVTSEVSCKHLQSLFIYKTFH